MKSGFILCLALVMAVGCHARMAEKVSEDDDFVVYRIPVKSLDLQPQATGYYEGMEFSPSHGRSSSKSSSSSKSTSSSTGSGRGKGYGQGASSEGHGHGHGGSSSGHGYGGGSSGQGYGGGSSGQGYGGGSSGQGYGGGSSGQGYGGSGSGYGGSGSGYGSSGSGNGYGGSGYGGHQRRYRQSPRTGHYPLRYEGSDDFSSPNYYRGEQASYTPGGYGSGSNTQHYDDDDHGYPKVVTSTKSYTTNSATNTGIGQQYRQSADSLGDINFRLGDYLKDAPGHENSHKYSQKLYEEIWIKSTYTQGFAGGDFAAAAPGLRSGQGFNVNEFTRTLNQGMANGFTAPSYRNNRFVPQASFVYPRAYAIRHAGFGLGGF